MNLEEAGPCKLAISEALLRGRHFDIVVVMKALIDIMANFMAVFIETVEEPRLTKEQCVTLLMEELRKLIDEKCDEHSHVGDLTVEMERTCSNVEQAEAQTRTCEGAILDVLGGGRFDFSQVMTAVTETMADLVAVFIESDLLEELGWTKEEFIARHMEGLRTCIDHQCERYRRYRARH
jgi:hypothetical protein